MNASIWNRGFILPAGDWYQIEVSGEHENRGADVVQVIDNRAVNAMVENFSPGESGLLIDAEHFSHDPDKATTAYGWLMAVENRNGELYGKIRWTGTGRPAVEGGDLRFFSTEYCESGCEQLDENRVRPMRLDGLTLTNRPNNRGGKPISNRESGEVTKTATATTSNTNTMKNTAKALGLPEDAPEGDVLAKIAEMKKNKGAAKNRINELEGKLKTVRNREADALIEEHKAKIGDDAGTIAFFRDGLINNREATEKALAALPEPSVKITDTKPLHNRATATPPEPVKGDDAAVDGAEQRKLVDDIRLKNRCSHSEAWSQAKREKPELF